MISRYEAYMDDIALSSVDPSIYVLDIQPTDPQYSNTFVSVANRPGAMLDRRRKESTGVTISFEIHEYNIQKRQDICQRVAKWADGKILKVNDRPDQILRCICEKYPVVSAKGWTDPVSMTFAAYNPPSWEEETPATATVTGMDETGQMWIPGNDGECLVEASVKANAAVSSFILTVGDTSITLSGLSLVADDVVTISYDENRIQRIKKGSTSLLDKRTGSDDLLAKSGAFAALAIEASGSISATFSARGCWK